MNARKVGESFKAYKIRRRRENRQLKERLQGRVVWDSENLGTYVKAEHGERKLIL